MNSSRLTYEDCEPFLALREGDEACVVKVFDGDSVTLGWTDFRNNNVRMPCRIRGIDTPEMRGSGSGEKALAVRARECLESKVLGETVTIRRPGRERWGRLLADLETRECKSVAEYMLENHEICRPYQGGRRGAW